MTNRSEQVEDVEADPWWWPLISKRAALREQFPPLSKVRSERPGCAADVERQRMFREETQLRKVKEEQARWDAAATENERRRERAESRRRNAAYRAYRDERKTA